MARGGGGPMPGVYAIDAGEAELLADANRDGGWLLSVDGMAQSYVDLSDPTYLDFEYLQLMVEVVGCMRAGALDVVHVGGGACTLARYIGAVRPGSRQLVVEPDAGLLRLVREQLALKSVRRLKVRVTDGFSGILALPEASDDLVVLDAFIGSEMPAELASVEYAGQVARVLRGDGMFLVNVTDGGRLSFARRMVATVRAVFPYAALIAEPRVLRGRGYGNLVVAASPAPLDHETLARRVATSPAQGRCLYGDDLDRFRSGAVPLKHGEEIPISRPH